MSRVRILSCVSSQIGSQRKSETVIHTGSQNRPSYSVGLCFGITVNKSYVSGLLRKAPFNVRLRKSNRATKSALAGDNVIIYFERYARKRHAWQRQHFLRPFPDLSSLEDIRE